MPYGAFEDGLYLLRRPSVVKGFDHYALMDVGNRIRHPQVNAFDQPVVIHQTPPHIKIEWLQDTGEWSQIGRVAPEHEASALARMRKAVKNPNYNLFGNNCEHFARYVAHGDRISTQVRAAVLVAGLVTLALTN